MGRLNYKEFSKRRRPHFDPLDANLFLTFRLFGSVPKSTGRYYRAKLLWLQDQVRRVERMADENSSEQMLRWKSEAEELYREWFLKTEDILHRTAYGPTWLRDELVADKVAENLHRLDGDKIRLDAYSIMSNHVHTVFQPLLSESDLEKLLANEGFEFLRENSALSRIMHSLKGRSARECNLLLGRTGAFWEHESFDRVIRNGKFNPTIRYVLNNPVKAGLVDDWEEWRWNYCREELVERFRRK